MPPNLVTGQVEHFGLPCYFVTMQVFALLANSSADPRMAWLPVVLLLIIALGFGIGNVVISAIICFFPIMVNALRGLRSVSDESLELMHVLDASSRQELLQLRLPASLPYLFGGLRIAATICFPGAMIAEWLTAARGLGYYIVDMQVRYRTDLVWAGLVTATLTGVALFTIVTLVERRVIRWQWDERLTNGGADLRAEHPVRAVLCGPGEGLLQGCRADRHVPSPCRRRGRVRRIGRRERGCDLCQRRRGAGRARAGYLHRGRSHRLDQIPDHTDRARKLVNSVTG